MKEVSIGRNLLDRQYPKGLILPIIQSIFSINLYSNQLYIAININKFKIQDLINKEMIKRLTHFYSITNINININNSYD
jgi:hypothetical protein